MSNLNQVDRALLEKIKSRIEDLAGLKGRADLTQKDLDFLLYYIQEKTGEALSLTTVKRIWRTEFQRLPHLSTLDLLSNLALNKGWHDAKKELLETNGVPDENVATIHAPSPNQRTHLTKSLVYKIFAAAVILSVMGLSWSFVSKKLRVNPDDVEFSAKVTADMRVPNSVVFTYDVSKLDADHFYLQQSWDPTKKVEIARDNNTQTDIYYEPGYHYAKLLADDQIIKEIPVHIRYNDWYVRFRYPDSKLIKVDQSDLSTTDHLGLKAEYVAKLAASGSSEFQLGYMLSKDFGLKADDLQLELAIRFDSTIAPPCPMVNVLIKGDKDYAWITFGNTGCESNLGLKVGDTRAGGKENDLSAMGLPLFSRQKITISIANSKYRLSANGSPIQQGTYGNTLGELKEVDVFFNGIGSIDDPTISSHGNLVKRF